MARPEWLLEPSQGYTLIASAYGEAGPVSARPGEIHVQAPISAGDIIGYGAWCEIEGYGPPVAHAALEIIGLMNEEGGVALPVLSQYQQSIMKTDFSGWVALVGTPYYDIPPYPESMTVVRADLYTYEVTGAPDPVIVGPWSLELYVRRLVAGGGATPELPDDMPCPPRLPWPYVEPITVPPRISSESGRVRRSNP